MARSLIEEFKIENPQYKDVDDAVFNSVIINDFKSQYPQYKDMGDDFFAPMLNPTEKTTMEKAAGGATGLVKKAASAFVPSIPKTPGEAVDKTFPPVAIDKKVASVNQDLEESVDKYPLAYNGLDRMNAAMARTPAFAYDVAMLPGNLMRKAMGQPEPQVQSPDWLMNNKVAEFYDESVRQTDYVNKRWEGVSFEDVVKRADAKEITEYILHNVMASAPQNLAFLSLAASGYGTAGLIGMGLISAADEAKRARDMGKDPAASTLNAAAVGTFEAAFERMGTLSFIEKWGGQLAKSFGKDTAFGIMKNVGKALVSSFVTEGSEELATSLSQDFSRYATGIDPNALKGSVWRGLGAFAVGGVAGTMMTTPATIATGLESAVTTINPETISPETMAQLDKNLPAVSGFLKKIPTINVAPEKVNEAIITASVAKVEAMSKGKSPEEAEIDSLHAFTKTLDPEPLVQKRKKMDSLTDFAYQNPVNPDLEQSSDILELDDRKMVNKKGKDSLDAVALRAIEYGFLPEGSTGREYVEALHNEQAGRFTRSSEDEYVLPERPIDSMSLETIDREIDRFQDMLAQGKAGKSIQQKLGDLLETRKRMVQAQEEDMPDWVTEPLEGLEPDITPQKTVSSPTPGQMQGDAELARLARANQVEDDLIVSLVDQIERDDAIIAEDYEGKFDAGEGEVRGVIRHTPGGQFKAIIELARGATRKTARHEFMHFARKNLLDQKQIAVLEDAFQGNQEDEADAFGLYMAEGSAGNSLVDKVFKVLKDFVDRMGNWMKGRGFQTVEDIFKAIDLGTVGRRGSTLKAGKTQYSVEEYDENFEKIVDQIVTQRRFPSFPIPIGLTPEILTKYGAKQIPIVVDPDVILKAFGPRHKLAVDAIKKIPALLRTPIMVFQSDTVQNSLVILTDMVSAEGRVVIPVHFDKRIGSGRYVVNNIASIYGKQDGSLKDWIGKGLLRFPTPEKAMAWFQSDALYLRKEGNKPSAVNIPETPKSVKPQFSVEQTKTPAFKKWFGNSKVVDENGKPLVVYHGTSESFNEFDPEKTGGTGFYFTADYDEAGYYSYITGRRKDARGDNIKPVYLSIKNPATHEAFEKSYAKASGGNPRKQAHEDLARQGYDGVIFRKKESGDIDFAIAFQPTQIKSAIGNRGTFSPKDPRIQYSVERRAPTESEVNNLVRESTEPQSVRKLSDNFLGRELAFDAVLGVMETSVLPVLKHDQVRRAIVKAIPVNVVNILADHSLSPEQLVSDPHVVGQSIPVNARSAITRGLRNALGDVGAQLRTALNTLLPTGRDGELLSTLKASDLNTSEVVRLLAPLRSGDLFTDQGGSTPAPHATKSSMSGAAHNITGVSQKLSATLFAELINRHLDIIGYPRYLVKSQYSVERKDEPQVGQAIKAISDSIKAKEVGGDYTLGDGEMIRAEDLVDSMSLKEVVGEKAKTFMDGVKKGIHYLELPQNYLYAHEDSKPVAEGVIDAFVARERREHDIEEFKRVALSAPNPEALAEIVAAADRDNDVNIFAELTKAVKAGKITQADKEAFTKGLYFIHKAAKDQLIRDILASRVGVRIKSMGSRYFVTYETKDGKVQERWLTGNQMKALEARGTKVTVLEEKEQIKIKRGSPEKGEIIESTRKVSSYDEALSILKEEEKQIIRELLPYRNYIPHARRGGKFWVEAYDQEGQKVYSARVRNESVAARMSELIGKEHPDWRIDAHPHSEKMRMSPSFGSMADVQFFMNQNGIDPTSEPGQRIINAYRSVSPLMASLIHSQNIAGYKVDWDSIVDSMALMASSGSGRAYRLDVKDLMDDVKNIKDDFRFNTALQYVNALAETQDSHSVVLQSIKSLTYFWLLANKSTYVIQNLTEPIWALARIESIKNPAGFAIVLNDEYKALLNRATEEGILKPFFSEQALAINPLENLQKLDILGRASEVWSSRKVFEIGLRLARDNGLRGNEAYRYAYQFLFNKGKPFYSTANKPIFTLNPGMRAYRQYGFMLLNFMFDWLGKFARGMLRNKLMTLMAWVLLGGFGTLPFGRKLMELFKFQFEKNARNYDLLDRFMLGGVAGMLGISPSFIVPTVLKGIPLPSGDIFRSINILGQQIAWAAKSYEKYGIVGAAGYLPLAGGQYILRGQARLKEGFKDNKKIIYRPRTNYEKLLVGAGLNPFEVNEYYRTRETAK